MILSARYIKKPRGSFDCRWCGRLLTEHIYLYGGADDFPMQAYRYCLRKSCCGGARASNPKIIAALAKAGVVIK